MCSICNIVKCDANLHLPSSWVETRPSFSAFSFFLQEKNVLLVTIPGEALVELGEQIRSDAADLGFTQTFLLGYSQNHLGYFATPSILF